jgi:uncharacterized protein
MKTGEASGAQIAFFTFALLLLIVPVSYLVRDLHSWSGGEWRLINRALPMVVLAAVLFGLGKVRRQCIDQLSRPIPAEHTAEVILVSVGSAAKAFAWAGLWILWGWYSLGSAGAEHRLQLLEPHEAHMARSITATGLAFDILLAGVLAPVLEELTFRGFLYRAWERQWGWIPSMLLTSTVFAFYHANFVPAFAASILYVCLYRRTGSLCAPIAAHSFFNVATSYPLLGQFVFQGGHRPSANPGSWELQIACLLFVVIALPFYVWMSRNAQAAAGVKQSEEAHAPLPS